MSSTSSLNSCCRRFVAVCRFSSRKRSTSFTASSRFFFSRAAFPELSVAVPFKTASAFSFASTAFAIFRAFSRAFSWYGTESGLTLDSTKPEVKCFGALRISFIRGSRINPIAFASLVRCNSLGRKIKRQWCSLYPRMYETNARVPFSMASRLRSACVRSPMFKACAPESAASSISSSLSSSTDSSSSSSSSSSAPPPSSSVSPSSPSSDPTKSSWSSLSDASSSCSSSSSPSKASSTTFFSTTTFPFSPSNGFTLMCRTRRNST
mmetsp:Transcript_11570/g.42852  ORF Transcript_11570/g.42852 Transcript_11570/m.42852 type:complete len:265 (+) Transcript_11570:1865-2659(+)